MLYVLFNILNLLRRHDELLSNFSPAGFTFKGFVVCIMLLIEQRFFCLEVPLGDLGQLKGLLTPKQRLTEASMFTIPRFYFITQSITLNSSSHWFQPGQRSASALILPHIQVSQLSEVHSFIDWMEQESQIDFMHFQGLKLPFLSASARDFNRSQQSCLEGSVCKHITLLALGNGATNKKYCEPWLSSF